MLIKKAEAKDLLALTAFINANTLDVSKITSADYISKIENNLKEVRISTLQKIVELGLGGHLNLSISL